MAPTPVAPDPWHYPRTALADGVLGLFAGGLSSALTFFAPRRMGKTEFLRKDIMPAAQARGWGVFYFSFLDETEDVRGAFVAALGRFMRGEGWMSRLREHLPRSVKVGGTVAGTGGNVELTRAEAASGQDLKALLDELGRRDTFTLLLLDEVQALAASPKNASFVAALRTGLDTNKDRLKTIFTGSSREGLRRMFSQANAPFFHFGQNLDFPDMDRGFTDHLAAAYAATTGRQIDTAALWAAFERLGKVPQMARSLVERLALNPAIELTAAVDALAADLAEQRDYGSLWAGVTPLDRSILARLANGDAGLFSEEVREQISEELGVPMLAVAAMQAAIRRLQRRGLVTRQSARGSYVPEDPNFAAWIRERDLPD